MSKKQELSFLIVNKGIIRTNFFNPVTFKSGIKSPIYGDFRACTGYPKDIMPLVIDLLYQSLRDDQPDTIIGVSEGAISFGAILGMSMFLPSGFIRKDSQPKDYGLKKIIEGVVVEGKTVGLIEDLVTTGGSVIKNAEILTCAGAKSVKIRSVFSYEFEKSKREFKSSGYDFKSVISIYDLLPFLQKDLSLKEYELLTDFVSDPEGWFNRHKF